MTREQTVGIFIRPRKRFMRAVNDDTAILCFRNAEEAQAYNENHMGNVQPVQFIPVDLDLEDQSCDDPPDDDDETT